MTTGLTDGNLGSRPQAEGEASSPQVSPTFDADDAGGTAGFEFGQRQGTLRSTSIPVRLAHAATVALC